VLRIALLTVVSFLLMAPVALAGPHDGGEGLWGETDDKVVTYTGFILIVGIPILITLLALLQMSLDRRKDRRLAAAKARQSRNDLRGGW
jgi:membrane protease YdiL (CAAX protease family)